MKHTIGLFYPISIALAVFLAPALASAESELVSFGRAAVGGRGCPLPRDFQPEIARVQKNHYQLKLNLKNFILLMNGSREGFMYKNCSFALPFAVNEIENKKYKLFFFANPVEGRYSLTGESSMDMNFEYFFAGTVGPGLQLKLKTGKGTFYLPENRHGVSFESACGADSILRMNINFVGEANGPQSRIDVRFLKKSPLVFHVFAVPCT